MPHIHLDAFKSDDFAGLENLVQLEFESLFHKFTAEGNAAFGEDVFAKLSKLEVLRMNYDQLGHLPDGVFAGLTSLKVLDLTGILLRHMPTSIYQLSKLESVVYNGYGLLPEQFAKVKEKLGDKLK